MVGNACIFSALCLMLHFNEVLAHQRLVRDTLENTGRNDTVFQKDIDVSNLPRISI